jgi:bifunctional DNA-binding transcriptional regulator/antitoxin component of YhaV-PrlF toxin-antitoxin module
MVKLQKHKAYVYTSGAGVKTPHYKHQVNIPEDILKGMGWKDGEELEWKVAGDGLKLTPKKE